MPALNDIEFEIKNNNFIIWKRRIEQNLRSLIGYNITITQHNNMSISGVLVGVSCLAAHFACDFLLDNGNKIDYYVVNCDAWFLSKIKIKTNE